MSVPTAPDYKTDDPAEQELLQQFTRNPGPGLDRELGVARLLLQRALNKGQGALSVALLRVLGGLSKEDYILKEKSRALLGKDAVEIFARQLMAIVLGAIADVDCSPAERIRFSDRIVHEVCGLLSIEAQQQPEMQHVLAITCDAKVL